MILVRSACLILCLVLAPRLAATHEVEVTLGGEKKTIWSHPHQPYLSIGTLEQLRQNFQAVKSVLPAMPFKMEEQWIIPAADSDTFRTFPDDSITNEYFSPNGDYVALIELAKGTVDPPRYSKRIRFMTTAGKLLWEKKDGPIFAVVTDGGRVIGRSQYNEDLSLTFYGRDGQVIKQLEQVFQPGMGTPYTGHLRLIPQEKMLLAWELRELIAISYDGAILWRYTTPRDTRIAFIHSPGLDPLGRGIYVPIRYKNDSSVELLDIKIGEVKGAVWRNKSLPIPIQYFSPSGRYAGIATENQIGLLDWKTGEVLFINKSRTGLVDLLEGKEVVVSQGDASDVADEPVRLVVPLSRGLGTSIFDASGKRIWWSDIRVGYARNFLSADSRTLGVASISSTGNEPITLHGVLLYQVQN